jgi:hypothetical protein
VRKITACEKLAPKLRLLDEMTNPLWASIAIFSIACSDPTPEDAGGPTGATCPEGSTLTYESFGRAFMAQYCTRCHSSTLQGTSRQGAPSDHNLDTLEGIEATPAEHIDEEAAAGPLRVNTGMPPSAPVPSENARRQLGEWLACGTP